LLFSKTCTLFCRFEWKGTDNDKLSEMSNKADKIAASVGLY